jgi:death on curing protein
VDEPVWIRADVVIAIHLRQLAEHSGRGGIRDAGLLDAALSRPRHLLAYAQPSPDLPGLAAAYAAGIVQNHPFVDGNKRVALVVARLFLMLNGLDLVASQQEKYLAVIRLAEGSSSAEEFAEWLRRHTAPHARAKD